MISIIPATDEHAVQVASRLRLEDALEARALSVLSPLEVVRGSIALSFSAWTWKVDDEPGCIFGLAGDMIGQSAMPWLLTTDLVKRHRKAFWRDSREVVRLMRETHPDLSGYCDARYAASVGWLKRLGFALDGPMQLGPFGMLFYRFRMGD